MEVIQNGGILDVVQRMLNHVDERLVEHGARVAYLVYRMLRARGGYTVQQQRDICTLALIHDIGAYKTEEIDRMVQFETETVWEHSVYGCLFVKHFTPLRALAPVVLFHHAGCGEMSGVCPELRTLAQMFHIADRADVYFTNRELGYQRFIEYIQAVCEVQFSAQTVDLFYRAGIKPDLKAQMIEDTEFYQLGVQAPFSQEEMDAYIRMMIAVIDFRSRHTVTHTVTTTGISMELAKLFGMDGDEQRKVVYGALFHDLGKIGIPLEILEYPGRLSPQAMSVMKGHVDITGEILGDSVDPEIREIALRHHEKLDGSGYPLALKEPDLTLSQRLVAVADIVSALCGVRSYKDAFSKQKTLQILGQMSEEGLIDRAVAEKLAAHFDGIMNRVEDLAGPVREVYHRITTEYLQISRMLAEEGAEGGEALRILFQEEKAV